MFIKKNIVINNSQNRYIISFINTCKNLKKPSTGLILFLIGMQLKFFVPLLVPSSREEGAAFGTYRYSFIAGLFIIAGAYIETRSTGYWLLKRYPVWTALGLYSLAVMISISYVQGQPVLSIYSQAQSFIWMFIVPSIMLRAKNIPWLIISFMLHAIIGSLYMLYVVFVLGFITRESLLFNDGYVFLMSCGYMALLLLFLVPKLSGKLFPLIAVGVYLVSSIVLYLSAFRFAVLMIPFQVILLVFIAYRTGFSHRVNILQISSVLVIIFISFFCVNAIVFGDKENIVSNFIMDANEQFISRMTSKGDVSSTVIENERVDEFKGALSLMTWDSWLIGKGIISNEYAPGMILYGALHNSFLNLFFWGGIFLFLFVMNPLLWVVRVLWYDKDLLNLASASFMLFSYLSFFGAIVYTPGMGWLLFCMLMGRCTLSESNFSQLTPAKQ